MIWRGEVHDVDLGQPIGHEPAFRRPAVVVSVDILNNGPGGLVMVAPMTSAAYGLRNHVDVETGSSGLGHTSHARCDQLRTISTERLRTKRGALDPETLSEIDRTLRFVLDL